jgi:hypothetical protein
VFADGLERKSVQVERLGIPWTIVNMAKKDHRAACTTDHRQFALLGY